MLADPDDVAVDRAGVLGRGDALLRHVAGEGRVALGPAQHPREPVASERGEQPAGDQDEGQRPRHVAGTRVPSFRHVPLLHVEARTLTKGARSVKSS